MSLSLLDPQQAIDEITTFISHTYKQANKKKAVIAVSGGIDSAVSCALLVRALGADRVTPLLLPYGKQSVQDSKAVLEYIGISKQQWVEVDIEPMVQEFARVLKTEEKMRLGNIMARCRMIVVYDYAKKLDALVCGTENKSEKYLAYFTRFGDEASDLEPIQHLYKTQIRQLAKYLQLPEIIQTKAPSAGLWQDQSDEAELGFSYEQADQVMQYYVDQAQSDVEQIAQETEIAAPTVQRVIDRISSNRFKHEVPYTL